MVSPLSTESCMISNECKAALTQSHPSWYEGFRYVYPVVSRRSRGVSVGVNLSPTKLCNFRCLYCQVNRGEKRAEIDAAIDRADPSGASEHDVLRRRPITCERNRLDLNVLESEILKLARVTLNGELFKVGRFADTEPERRVLRDIAFSGDGEPTLAPQFPEAVSLLVDARRRLGYESLLLLLITNATRLMRPEIVDALDEMHDANGEIWVKLDAGDLEYFRMIDRTAIPFDSILKNIIFASKRWRVKIQTALLSCHGAEPSDDQFARYCERVDEIMQAGGYVQSVQLYTVARPPSDPSAKPLPNDVMDRYAETLRRKTGARVEVFYSR